MYPCTAVVKLIIKRIGILSVNFTSCLHYHIRRDIVKRIDNPQSMIYRTKEINNLQFVTYDWLKVLYLYSTDINDKRKELYLITMTTRLINFWRPFLPIGKAIFDMSRSLDSNSCLCICSFRHVRHFPIMERVLVEQPCKPACNIACVHLSSIEEVVESDEDQTDVYP